jgi:hypothetical protein
MSNEKLNKIVEMVYKATINGSLKWSLANSIFNSDTRHKYTALSADGITTFSCAIDLKKDLNFNKGSRCSMDISNPNIVDDVSYLWSDKYPVIESIHEWIYTTHIKPSINLANQDDVMDGILSSIDVSEYRDQKIETILNDKPIIEEKTEVNQSFFKKLFGK